LDDLLSQTTEVSTSFDIATQWPMVAIAIVAIVILHYVFKGILKIAFIVSVIALLVGYMTGHLDPVVQQVTEMTSGWFSDNPGY